MKNKKVWMGAVAVFIALAVMDFIFYMLLFKPGFESISHLMRPEAEIKMWALVVAGAFFAYFFTWIFSKGYEGKGILEGVRYGLALAFMTLIPFLWGNYAIFMVAARSPTLHLVLYGTAEFVICGIVLAWIFGMKPKTQSAA